MIRKLALFSLVLTLPALGLLFAQPNQGRTFAFLVACGDYDKTQLNPVSFTVPEMQAFRQVLIDSGVPDKNIVFLHDKSDEPRRYLPVGKNIVKEFSLLLERVKAEDSVIVALSGHGLQFKDDKFGHFCPLDADLNKKETLLPMEGKDGLLTRIDQCKATRKFLIVNACRNKPASSANLAAERLQLRDDYAEEAPKGTVMLLACSKGQFSWGYDEKEKNRPERKNRSLFMYHLIEAWKGSYAKGQKVTVDHVVNQVTERVETDCNPDFGHNQFPIAKRKFEGRWELATVVAAKQIEADLGSGVKLKLAYIPAGKFLMGSPKEEKERVADKELQHEVEITKGFYMGVYEVTQEQYEAIMEKNPSHFNGAKLPVEEVSWEDAKAFCKKLSAKEGKTYRLPTEAEWEYACRSGTTTPFHFGETISPDQVNYDGNGPYGNGQKGIFRGKTTVAGSFAANAFGLHDMHGNVMEWCEDWYGAKYYDNSPRRDPLNATEGSSRVIRGGGWILDAGDCRSAVRGGGAPGIRNDYLGFRVARSSVE